MNKEQFNKLDIKLQLEHFNKLLKQFNSISQVCKKIGIAPSTIKDRFKAHGYYFDVKIKEYLEVVERVNNTEDYDRHIKSYTDKVNQNDKMTDVIHYNTKELVLNSESLKAIEFITLNLSKLENIVNNVDEISCNIGYDTIKIDIPDVENIRTTIKVNSEVWRLFSELAIKNKLFDKQDLISQALFNFYKVYSKK